MPRAIWTGDLSFGLVSIPVGLHSAERRDDISFNLLDRRTHARIQYKRIDEKTGQEVPWEEIVRGYEYEKGRYIILSDEDLKRANVEATQTIEIVDFVEAEAISPAYLDRPYYLEPQKRGRKGYALLREVLVRTGKVGIARLVLRTRAYIAAVYPAERALVVNLLRYAYELRDPNELNLPEEDIQALDVTAREIQLAEQLVQAMVSEWEPEKYKDTYREDLLKMIEERVEKGQLEAIEEPAEAPRAAEGGRVVDIMDLLKKSVEEKTAGRETPARKPSKRRAG